MEEEIKAQFNRSGFNFEEDKEEILNKCHTFCINYTLTPADLVSCWELYYLNRQLTEPILQIEEMDGFFMHLQNHQKEAAIKEESVGLHMYSSKDVDMILNDEVDDINDIIPDTPTNNSLPHYSQPFDSTHKENLNAYSATTSILITPFARRTNKVVVKFAINNLPVVQSENTDDNMDDDIIKKVPPIKSCSLTLHGSMPETGCRFMYDRIEDKFNALENRIKSRTAALVSSELHDQLLDPTVASQSTVFAVGMICCDGEGHLNEKSVLLQSSIEHSGGQRVRLDLHEIDQFSLFPGQVVGIQGQNPSGHCLIATKVIDSMPLTVDADDNPQPRKKLALAEEIQSADLASTKKDVSMMIASGPFTTIDNLLFEPLTELIAYSRIKQPQLLILLGPFVDSEHSEIKKGTTNRSFDEIFHQEILQRLQDYTECMGSESRVVLVPSIRDANHDFVFPQPPFDINPPNLKYQITSLTNPGTFEANEVKVGCCTVDVIKQLSGEEMSRNPTDGTSTDRMSKLAGHILNQKSFYPLYPAAESIPLDYSVAPEALQISWVPDILIVPSDMKYFVKVLSLGGGAMEGEEVVKCVCINPGRLAKGEGGGTFVELNYQGSPDSMNASILSI
ncbi:hypothetical protein ACFE04_022640 [Oxalis oulophora]